MMKQIDGEPRSYYTASDGQEYPYMIVRGYAYEEDIAHSLKTRLISEIEKQIPEGTIIWRTRPEVFKEKAEDNKWRWHAYMRLATIPVLSHGFWARFSVNEGEPGPRIYP